MEKTTERVWVVAKNNLENMDISATLSAAGETVLGTYTSSWKKIGKDIKSKVQEMLNPNLKLTTVGEWSVGNGYTWGATVRGTYEEFLDDSRRKLGDFKPTHPTVYVIGLQDAPTFCNKLDDDKEKSSIEKVADFLGVDLTVNQRFIAANSRGGASEMRTLGEKLGLSEEGIEDIISDISMADRRFKREANRA